MKYVTKILSVCFLSFVGIQIVITNKADRKFVYQYIVKLQILLLAGKQKIITIQMKLTSKEMGSTVQQA